MIHAIIPIPRAPNFLTFWSSSSQILRQSIVGEEGQHWADQGYTDPGMERDWGTYKVLSTSS